MTHHYFSLQYSAIQKTVLRHDRLWSIAGISQGLAKLNEIDFIRIAETEYKGKVLVAGGGKFTAKFPDNSLAEGARSEICKRLATSFPMLEYQISEVVVAESLADAKENKQILLSLGEQKQRFRGYAASYLPHLAVCAECGEFPAETVFKIPVKEGGKWKDRLICRTCMVAYDQAKVDFKNIIRETATTLEQIYLEYLRAVSGAGHCKALHNFDDMFPDDDATGDKTSKKRMAVWFSDLNNMNQKVPIWLGQNEDEILKTFNTVKAVNISVVAKALISTFSDPDNSYLPFRIVVAGGDDLCLVMPEQYILDFIGNLADATHQKVTELDKDPQNPLNTEWLQKRVLPDPQGTIATVKPYSFGGSFVLASLHTPFKAIHALGEKLMSDAKTKTDRQGNSVNWRIMAEDGAVADTILDFDRPLFIEQPDVLPAGWNKLNFAEYMKLRDEYKGVTGSHRFALVDRLLRFADNSEKLTTELKKYDSNQRIKSFSGLLTESKLQSGGFLVPERLATLLELMSIKKTSDKDEERI